jgi:hypothetical protein
MIGRRRLSVLLGVAAMFVLVPAAVQALPTKVVVAEDFGYPG